MFAPTLDQLEAAVYSWWRTPGALRLSVLQSQLAALCTESNSRIGSIEIIDNNDDISLRAVLEHNGVVVREIIWAPPDGERQETLLDVFDPILGMTHRQRRAMAAAEIIMEV